MRALLMVLAFTLAGTTSFAARPKIVSPTGASDAGASRFVVMGEGGQAIARVITGSGTCPSIVIDGTSQPMRIRAPAETIAQRMTRSDPADSKPSAFPVTSCEIALPKGTRSASVDGAALPVPKAEMTRIVVIGDTGCRLKKALKQQASAWQACGDPAAYPFARIATAAAAWKPDLIVHVGDYHYRENACPDDQPQCKGSPWGYGWDAWNADFFAPGAALLRVAPLAAVRGNHENCNRGGQGWWRFIDPRPLLPGRDCNADGDDLTGDYSDPYAVPLGHDAQLIMLDLAMESSGPITAPDPMFAKYREVYRKYAMLAAQQPYTIAANHHPILAFAASLGATAADQVSLRPGSVPIQSAFSSLNPWIIPDNVQILLSGHIHVWEQLSFKSRHPTQFVAGFSGTQEDAVPLPAALDENASPAAGAEVAHFSSWVNGFGWMSMERIGRQTWAVTVWDMTGKPVNRCTVTGKDSVCDIAHVTAP
jgi:hypothetical protein